MCGIGGIFVRQRGRAPAPSIAQLTRMAAALRHRGPDEFGVYRDARCGFAHARLSIIDLVTGQQPLSTPGGEAWIVFNGEIFNYVELRAELAALGHRFRTRSDTEVAVTAYRQWGEEAFARFNGQFAIAIWDVPRQSLVLARDLAGILPLHVAEHGPYVVFGSEVKAIFAAAVGIVPAFDPVGLEQTFTFWSIVPPRGIFQGVGELEPGHVRVYTDEGVRERAFAAHVFPSPHDPGFRGSLDDATEAVRGALHEATRLRMVRADVPVGSYLSGGLDSSLVAALGCDARGETFRTFSLRFEDAEYDETPFQREMVRHLGSDHAELVVSRDDIAEAFARVVYHAERPVLRTAPVPMYLLSGLVRGAGIKVVLTGEGADEFFAGYDLFREAKVRRFWARQPESPCRPLLLDRLYPYLSRSPVSQRAMARRFFGRNLQSYRAPGFSHDMRWQGTASLKRMFSAELRAAIGERDVVSELVQALPPEFQHWPWLAQDQYLEIRTLLAGYLLSSQGDRMLMGHSVEGRFPFLDPDVIALANSLPPSYKLRVLDEKHILKRASHGRLPASILQRKKQPYRAPDVLSFVGPRQVGWVDSLLESGAVRSVGVFEADAVGALWQKCKDRARDPQFSNTDNMALVGVLSTQILHDRLIRSTPESSPIELTTLIDRLEGEVHDA
jgi:asparagine synthase (glutamine-hydrolysing)